MTLTSDVYLINKMKLGNYNAFDQMFVKYYKLLCLNAYSFIKDDEEAKEIVQIFFSDFWEKKLYLNMHGEIKGYFYRSIQNRCLNHIRKKETELKKQKQLAIDLENIDEEAHFSEKTYLQLENVLQEIPKQRREALRIVYFENKKYQEAADSMGISINSLKTHLKLGLKNLRKKMKYLKEFT